MGTCARYNILVSGKNPVIPIIIVAYFCVPPPSFTQFNISVLVVYCATPATCRIASVVGGYASSYANLLATIDVITATTLIVFLEMNSVDFRSAVFLPRTVLAICRATWIASCTAIKSIRRVAVVHGMACLP